MAELMTLRDVARRYSEPLHRVKYAVAEADIQPAGWIGNTRVFTEDQLPAIREALDKSARRELAGAVAHA